MVKPSRPPLVVALLLAATLLLGGGCAPAAPQPAELTVFAAASLTDAFSEIGRGFERANPGVTVVFNFAGSQQLAAQLAQGAPGDVFASANAAQMQAAVDAGRVASDASRTFVQNRLVVVAAPAAPVAQLQDLARPGLKLVFAAEAVPVGKYTLEFLDKAAADPAFAPGFRDSVLKNVVSYEDNVRAVLTKVSLGEADAGVVYLTDAAASPGTPVARIEIPTPLNVLASYPVAPVSDSKQPELARKFIDYLAAADARATLERYGFTLP